MDKYLWAAYHTDTHNVFGGREFLGYAGWHLIGDNAGALAAAQARYPETDPAAIAVSIA